VFSALMDSPGMRKRFELALKATPVLATLLSLTLCRKAGNEYADYNH
jgi:hypothetical protein